MELEKRMEEGRWYNSISIKTFNYNILLKWRTAKWAEEIMEYSSSFKTCDWVCPLVLLDTILYSNLLLGWDSGLHSQANLNLEHPEEIKIWKSSVESRLTLFYIWINLSNSMMDIGTGLTFSLQTCRDIWYINGNYSHSYWTSFYWWYLVALLLEISNNKIIITIFN